MSPLTRVGVRPQLTSQRIIQQASGTRVVFQVWQWQEEQYRLTQFFIVQDGPEWRMRSYTTFYRALRRTPWHKRSL